MFKNNWLRTRSMRIDQQNISLLQQWYGFNGALNSDREVKLRHLLKNQSQLQNVIFSAEEDNKFDSMFALMYKEIPELVNFWPLRAEMDHLPNDNRPIRATKRLLLNNPSLSTSGLPIIDLSTTIKSIIENSIFNEIKKIAPKVKTNLKSLEFDISEAKNTVGATWVLIPKSIKLPNSRYRLIKNTLGDVEMIFDKMKVFHGQENKTILLGSPNKNGYWYCPWIPLEFGTSKNRIVSSYATKIKDGGEKYFIQLELED